ncbi:otoferlin-like [Latimeria chalumnae]|uniref:otoferlin-like n=1 Tax=Latimeria chalumnae TaxID=7897 RepID=UPI00313BF8D0
MKDFLLSHLHNSPDMFITAYMKLSVWECNHVNNANANSTNPIQRECYKSIVQKAFCQLGPRCGKAQDYEVCINIIAAQRLVGHNIAPYVCVEIGDQKRQTSKCESTNCPFYNEYFVFDFHLPQEVLFDKIIKISVFHSKNIVSGKTIIGTFKVDIWTVYSQPEHQFFHKWAPLTDTNDIAGGIKGYLKCDISVMGKGDIKKATRPGKDGQDEDIEGNLLLPPGFPMEQKCAKIAVSIYRAEGLSMVQNKLISSMKKVFTKDIKDLINPSVVVYYADQKGRTSVKKNCAEPIWNEQIIFTELFPVLCRRMKIQIRDLENPVAIGTHFIDMTKISHSGDKGFLPTFGPAWINLYGSSMTEEDKELDEGIGEGSAYRGRLLISIDIKVFEKVDSEAKETEVVTKIIPAINERLLGNPIEFLLFAAFLEASMIDRRHGDKAIKFQVTIGSYGENLAEMKKTNLVTKENEEETCLTKESLSPSDSISVSCTSSVSPCITHSCRAYCHMPYEKVKPCVYIRNLWEDHRWRIFNANRMDLIATKLEEGINIVAETVNQKSTTTEEAEKMLILVLMELHHGCLLFLSNITDQGSSYWTKLDERRLEACRSELTLIAQQAATLCEESLPLKEKLKSSQLFLQKIQHLQDELPGKHVLGQKGRTVQAKVDVYFWLGVKNSEQDTSFLNGLPKGYELTMSQLQDSSDEVSLLYHIKHEYQLRTHLFQARGLLAIDDNGLSDPFARVLFSTSSQSTEIAERTLSPTWDQTLVFQEIVLYGDPKDIQDRPPKVIIEIFDHNKGGRFEFIGQTCTLPAVKLSDEKYQQPHFPPLLDFVPIYWGDMVAGELLAAFELLQVILAGKHCLTEIDGLSNTEFGPIVQVPLGIRPIVRKYRIEVLFWGLRDLKRLQVVSAIRPRVDIECAGKGIKSSVLLNYQRHPNFSVTVKEFEVDLPEDGRLHPPIEIHVINCGAFGSDVLLGSHTVMPLARFFSAQHRNAQEQVQRIGFFQQVTSSKLLARNGTVQRDRHDFAKQPVLLCIKMHCLGENHNLKTVVSKEMLLIEIKELVKTNGYICYLPVFCFVLELENTIVNVETDNLIETADSGWMTVDQKGYLAELVTARSHKLDPNNDYNQKKSGSRHAAKPSCASYEVYHLSESEVPTSTPEQKHIQAPLPENDELDWWSKYYASIEDTSKSPISYGQGHRGENSAPKQITKADNGLEGFNKNIFMNIEENLQKTLRNTTQHLIPRSSKTDKTGRECEIQTIKVLQVYTSTLESEFNNFEDWLYTFPLYRGKAVSNEVAVEEDRVVGKFKGSFCVYSCSSRQLPSVFTNIPSNNPVKVIIRIYVVRATSLHPADPNGKADPYIRIRLGSQEISDMENYVSKQLNPVFGRCFQLTATFPAETLLSVSIYDWDLLSSDDLIGETLIDLENRYYSRHRATCGLPFKYNVSGYNAWRDAMKPTQILAKLCRENKIPAPDYLPKLQKVKVANCWFQNTTEQTNYWRKLIDEKQINEELALVVLHSWQEVPHKGYKLVPEHVETRPLFNHEKPGVTQGYLQMWVDMFPTDIPTPGAPVDISPRKPQRFELRVTIWNTEDVVLADVNQITGLQSCDIYVTGWLQGKEDQRERTDVYYNSFTGEGKFNWRFVFRFDYLNAEKKMVVTRKQSLFSVDKTECKVPPVLMLQVWDADIVSADDFLGSLHLDLTNFPWGAKTAQQCTLDMLKDDAPKVNMFKQRVLKGWWPFISQKRERDHMLTILTGKVEAELHLVTEEEADKNPVGLGRNAPEPLEKPNRPDMLLSVFYANAKSIACMFWRSYKKYIIIFLICFLLGLFLFLFLFNFPQAISHKMVNG